MIAVTIPVSTLNRANRIAWSDVDQSMAGTNMAPLRSGEHPVGETPDQTGDRRNEEEGADERIAGPVLRLNLLRHVVREPAQCDPSPDEGEDPASGETEQVHHPVDRRGEVADRGVVHWCRADGSPGFRQGGRGAARRGDQDA